MLYELAATELKETQLILVVKELFRPDKGYDFTFVERRDQGTLRAHAVDLEMREVSLGAGQVDRLPGAR
jgi:hypothetical protein